MAVSGVGRRRILVGAAALAVALVACVPPPPPHVPAVTIVEPTAGATVTSPMHVTGTASVFEAVFFLEVTDGVGTVLTTQRLMASCGTGCPGTFDTTVSVPVGAGSAHAHGLHPVGQGRQPDRRDERRPRRRLTPRTLGRDGGYRPGHGPDRDH